jgi:enoyl-CoA hydratase
MERKNVILTKEGPVATIKMNRPEALNALNVQTLEELRDVIAELEEDVSVKVAVLTGEGKAFVAGADIKQMSEMGPLEAKRFARMGHAILDSMESSRVVYIAAVNGFALGGGCEIMMSCDIAIASNRSKIGQPEINLGIHPGFGGTQRLPRLIGRMRAKELLLTGDNITADEAYRLGLVNRVVEPDALIPTAKEIAAKIASKSAVQISFIKTMVNRGTDIDLISAKELEISYFIASFATEDRTEGMKAFIEKRKPEFKDR